MSAAMTKLGLTKREADLLAFLDEFTALNSHGPSFQEMSEHIGTTKSGVHRLVEALHQRGHILRLRNHASSISVRHDLPADIEAALSAACRESGCPRHAFIEAALREYLGCEAPSRPQRAAESLLRGRA